MLGTEAGPSITLGDGSANFSRKEQIVNSLALGAAQCLKKLPSSVIVAYKEPWITGKKVSYVPIKLCMAMSQ